MTADIAKDTYMGIIVLRRPGGMIGWNDYAEMPGINS